MKKTLLISTLGLVIFSSLASAEDSDKSQNIVTEGDFANTSGNFYQGWQLSGFLGFRPESEEPWKNTVRMANDDDGTPYVRLECLDPEGENLGISQTENIVLNPAWSSLVIAADVRIAKYKRGSDWGGRVQLTIEFFDANHVLIPGEFYVGKSGDIAKWKRLEEKIAIPRGAVELRVSAQVMGATAIADFKGISVTPK